MINLKMDIEDKLWAFFEKEQVFQLQDAINALLPPKDRADSTFKDSPEITDKSHPVARLCFDIAAKHEFPVQIKVFEGDLGKADKVMGCIAGEDFLYFHFQNRIQDQLDPSEISHIVAHEFGHYFSRTKVNPEETCSPNILKHIGLSEEEGRQ